MAGHYVKKCTHGVIVEQCRCIGTRETIIVPCPKWCAKNHQQQDAADIPKFRALAKRAAELGERREIADTMNADQILDELAAMHKETP